MEDKHTEQYAVQDKQAEHAVQDKQAEHAVQDGEENPLLRALAELDDETVAAMTEEEEILLMMKRLNPYGTIIEGSGNLLTMSIINVREQYMRKLITTGIIGFLSQMNEEWGIPDGAPVISPYDYINDPEVYKKMIEGMENPSQDFVDMINEAEAGMQERIVVQKFLEHCFQFNPNEHVKSAYKPNPADPERRVLKGNSAQLAIDHRKKKDKAFADMMDEYERVMALRDMSPRIEELKNPDEGLLEGIAVADPVDFGKDESVVLRHLSNMIPPSETFYRFNMYYEKNYDKLREAVQHLYCEKPDIEFAICPHNWHATEEDAKEYIEKHANSVIASVYTLNSSSWNLMGPFAKNAERTEFYGKNSEVITELLKGKKEDAKEGGELLKKRVKRAKRRNIKHAGANAPEFDKWKAKHQSKLTAMGAATPAADEYDSDECPDDAVESTVWVANKKGGLTKKKLYFQAEAPKQRPPRGPM